MEAQDDRREAFPDQEKETEEDDQMETFPDQETEEDDQNTGYGWSDTDPQTDYREPDTDSDTESELGSPQASGHYDYPSPSDEYDPMMPQSDPQPQPGSSEPEKEKKNDGVIKYVIDCATDDCGTCPGCEGELDFSDDGFILIDYCDYSYNRLCEGCFTMVVIKNPRCIKCRPKGYAVWEVERVRRKLILPSSDNFKSSDSQSM